MPSDKTRENKLRRQLQTRLGWSLHKSRSQISVDNLGGYRIVDDYTNAIVAGEKFDLDLDDVEQFIKEAHAEEQEVGQNILCKCDFP